MNMSKARCWTGALAALAIAQATLAPVALAQKPARLKADDTTAIRALVASYARALGDCRAEEFADLFAPTTGYFASGFRGQMVGRDKLIALVKSERHCVAPPATPPAARPGGTGGPAVDIKPTVGGAHGVANLGTAEYQDDYVKTPAGWRIAARVVLLTTEKAAGIEAPDLIAIMRLGGGTDTADFYEKDASGGPGRLLTSGVRVTVTNGEVTGRAFRKDGSYDDQVYEKRGPGDWRVKSSAHVPAGAAALPASGAAQPAVAPNPRGAVLGTGAVTSFVENMDRSLAFYHDAFGMEVPALPESGARVYNPSNSQLFAMFDIAGAKERHQSAQIPETNVRLELMEVQDVAHSTINLRVQDPGSMTLVFVVRDAAKSLERARGAGAEVITPGGKLVTLADGSRSVLIRDADGRPIELRQPTKLPADAKGADVTALRLSIAVADMAKTLAAYRDVLAFMVESDERLGADKALRALTGLPKAEIHRAVIRGPGSTLPIELVEYGGVDRKPLDMKIQDRGAARLQIRAENLEPLVARMRQAGMRVVSVGGGPVPIPPNLMGALVADPNNFFLTPFAPCDKCAPRLVSEPAH